MHGVYIYTSSPEAITWTAAGGNLGQSQSLLHQIEEVQNLYATPEETTNHLSEETSHALSEETSHLSRFCRKKDRQGKVL